MQAGGGGMGWLSVAPLIFIFAIFYFLLILPQQRRQKKWTAMLDSLKTGDTGRPHTALAERSSQGRVRRAACSACCGVGAVQRRSDSPWTVAHWGRQPRPA